MSILLLALPGFVPAAEALLFRQKDPKPCWPWCGPLPPQGQALRVPCAVRRTPSALLRTGPAARKLAEPVLSLVEGLKHCAPFFRDRLHGSATPQGQGKLLKNGWTNEMTKITENVTLPLENCYILSKLNKHWDFVRV